MSRGDKSKQITCYAIDACTQDQVIDIFEESFGYLSFTEKFVQRIHTEPIDYESDAIANSDKPLIVLDIDNTILFVRFFSDEICVNDPITYYHEGIEETSGTVIAVWYRLKLQLSDDDLIDEYGTDLIEYDHCHTLSNRLKKKKKFNLPYKIDEKTNEILDCRQTLIKELSVIGCEIEYKYTEYDDDDDEDDDNIHHKFISFEEDSTEIENFLPSLTRKGYKDAAFVYDGFIVRIRNGVEDFLDQLDESWDIVFFTAANRTIYTGLMKQLHSHLCDIMGRDEETDDPLWKHIFFRDDCTYDFDERGKIYHHKDLTKYNRDLSKVIIVDNSALSYKSLEPNAILIKDFFGKDMIDNELDIVLDFTDQIIDFEMEFEDREDVYIDYRYILTNIINDVSQVQVLQDLHVFDRRNPDDILQSTQRFLNDLKESLLQRGLLPTTLKFGEPKNQPIDTDDDMDDGDNNDNKPQSILPVVDEDEDADDLDHNKSLIASKTQEITFEGLTTPNASTDVDDVVDSTDDDETKQDLKSTLPQIIESKEESHDIVEIEEKKQDNNFLISMPNKLNNKTRDSSKSTQLSLPSGFNRRGHGRQHSYSITLNLADIPNFGYGLDESESEALGAILQTPTLMTKFSELNEHQMRQNIDSDPYGNLDAFGDTGVGSNTDDDSDDTESSEEQKKQHPPQDDVDVDQDEDDDESDWDDIDEEQQEEEKKIDIDTDETKQELPDTTPPRHTGHTRTRSDAHQLPFGHRRNRSDAVEPNPVLLMTRTRSDANITEEANNNNEEAKDEEKATVNVEKYRRGRKKRDSVKAFEVKQKAENMKDLPQRPMLKKKYSMKPRPDSASIASGMSSVFLKMHRHWYSQRRASLQNLAEHANLYRRSTKDDHRKGHRRSHSSRERILGFMQKGGKKIKHAVTNRTRKRKVDKVTATEMQPRKLAGDFDRNLNAFNQLNFGTPSRPSLMRRRRESANNSVLPYYAPINGYYPDNNKKHRVYDGYFDISLDSKMD